MNEVSNTTSWAANDTDPNQVPVYDARAEDFNVGKWWNDDYTHAGALLPGSAVMVFFSVRGYDYQGKYGSFGDLDTAVGFSILSIILVNDQWDAVRQSQYVHIGNEAFGVDRIRCVDKFETVEDMIV